MNLSQHGHTKKVSADKREVALLYNNNNNNNNKVLKNAFYNV